LSEQADREAGLSLVLLPYSGNPLEAVKNPFFLREVIQEVMLDNG
jgi:hypothetical protein